MDYTFDGVMHSSFSFTIKDVGSFEEAIEKSRELNKARYYHEFPEANIGEVDLHLCYAVESDDNGVVRGGCIDEWV